MDENDSCMSQPLVSRQLRAFTVLARTGIFTRTESAISSARKTREVEIGCRLLDRVGKSVLLARPDRILAEMNPADG